MSGICRIYRQNGHGMKLIAEVRGGKVKGREADRIRALLRQYGFPRAPMDAVIDQLLQGDNQLGVAMIPERKDFRF